MLVTADNATKDVGTTMKSSANAGIPGGCFYVSADGTKTVLVFANKYPDAKTADSVSPDQMAAAMNGTVGVTNATPVDGIGDKAVAYTVNYAGTTGAAIFVFKANVVFMILLSPATDITAVKAMASDAVTNLSKIS